MKDQRENGMPKFKSVIAVKENAIAMKVSRAHHIGGNAAMFMALLFALPGAAIANPRYDAWQENRPFTQTSTGQHEFGGDRIHLEEFKGSGLNTAMDSRWFGSQTWPIPETYGLPTIYMAYTRSGMQYFLGNWNEARAKHENIVAVLLGDEMTGMKEDELRNVRDSRDWIVNNPDPAVSSLITIDSEAPGDTISANKGAQASWDKQFEAILPDVWLAQFNGFRGASVNPSYYSSLEWYFNWAKRKDVAMWCWLTAWASSAQDIPSESELRLQRFTSLAYGVRGFADFIWTANGSGPSVKGAGYWDGSGKPTRMYTQLQTINKEIASIAKSLIRLTPVRAYHMDGRDDGDAVRHWSDMDDDLPAWMRRTGRLANVTGAVNGNHLLVGFFRDRAGEEYFMVVNKDIAKDADGAKLATPVTLTFHPGVKAIQRLSRSTGTAETVALEDNYVFELDGGTGDLFKFSTGAQFAGVGKPSIPTLVSTDPVHGSLCAVANNQITLEYNGSAREVVPEIRIIGKDGRPTGSDLGEKFERRLSADGKTLTLMERGSILANKATFQLCLHYSDSPLISLSKLLGDVNADGELTADDIAVLTKAMASSDLRGDINGDGRTDESDRVFLSRLVNARPFEWRETFDSYPVGPLAGNGPWAEAEGFAGSSLAKAWISRTALVARQQTGGQSGRAASGATAVSMDFIGNEARFANGEGLGEFGLIRLQFTIKAGTNGFQNNGIHLWNTRDKAGEWGDLGSELESGDLKVFGGRGVTMLRHRVAAPVGSGHSTDPFRVNILVDCDRRIVEWQGRNLVTGDSVGPFELPYMGIFKGMDGVSLFLGGEGGAIDDIVISNY